MAALLLVLRSIALDTRGAEVPVERVDVVGRKIEFGVRGLTGKQKYVGVPHLEDRDDAGPGHRLMETDRVAIERRQSIEVPCPEADVAHRDDPAGRGHAFSISISPVTPLSTPFHAWPWPDRPSVIFVASASSAMKVP